MEILKRRYFKNARWGLEAVADLNEYKDKEIRLPENFTIEQVSAISKLSALYVMQHLVMNYEVDESTPEESVADHERFALISSMRFMFSSMDEAVSAVRFAKNISDQLFE